MQRRVALYIVKFALQKIEPLFSRIDTTQIIWGKPKSPSVLEIMGDTMSYALGIADKPL